MRNLIKEALFEDYDVTTFESGKLLLEHIDKSNSNPDLYLLDIKMPDLNGIETAKLIREKDENTPIIAMSGYLNDTYYKGLFEHGFYEAIPKPFSIEVLLKKIKNAIDNALIPSYKRLVDLFTLTMAHMGDARDTLTEKHNLRIGEFSYLLAQEMQFSSQIFEDIKLSSRLHDIGKISIIDEVLQKKGKLTSEEFEYMKTHTTKGAAMLDGLATETHFRYLGLASEIALYHHEKLNGAGYPNRIKAEEIPLYVRIVTVADIYDAVTMKRPYHEARPHEEGVKVLKEEVNQGRLDEDVIRAFLIRERDIKEIKEIYY